MAQHDAACLPIGRVEPISAAEHGKAILDVIENAAKKEPEGELARQLALGKGGARFDTGKTRVDLIPAEVLLELGEIYRMGAEKYDATNWRKGMRFTKVYGPLMRHLLKAWIGKEVNDPESGRPHIYHAVWNVVALAFYMTRPEYARFDDRMDNQDFVSMTEADRQARYV